MDNYLFLSNPNITNRLDKLLAMKILAKFSSTFLFSFLYRDIIDVNNEESILFLTPLRILQSPDKCTGLYNSVV